MVHRGVRGLLLLIGVSFALLACGSGPATTPPDGGPPSTPDGEPPTTPDAPGAWTLTADATEVSPLQVLTLSSATPMFPQGTTVTAMFEGAAVSVGVVDASRLAVIIPDGAAPGASSLTVTANGAAYAPIMLTVVAPPPIADPMAVVTAQIDATRARLGDTPVSDPAIQAAVTAARANLDRIEAQLASLSPDELRQVALALAVNTPDMMRNHLEDLATQFLRLVIKIGVVSFLGYAGGPIGAVVAGIINADLIPKLIAVLIEIANTRHVIDGEVTAVTQVVAHRFTSGASKLVRFIAPQRALNASDASSSNATIAEVVSWIVKLASIFSTINTVAEPDYPAPPGFQEGQVTGPVTSTHISIVGWSPDVQLVSAAGAGDAVSIAFNGDGMCTQFSFTARFDDHVTEPFELTVPAALDCEPCGHVDEPCCEPDDYDFMEINDDCEQGLECDTATSTCVMACGGVGEPCCDPALDPAPSVPFGNLMGMRIVTGYCDSGAGFDSMCVVPDGAEEDADWRAGTCTSCGDYGQSCCPFTQTSAGELLGVVSVQCTAASGRAECVHQTDGSYQCVRTGYVGERCAVNDPYSPPVESQIPGDWVEGCYDFNPSYTQNYSMCEGGTCIACGKLGEPCCPYGSINYAEHTIANAPFPFHEAFTGTYREKLSENIDYYRCYGGRCSTALEGLANSLTPGTCEPFPEP